MTKYEMNIRYQRLVKNVQATYKAWQGATSKEESTALKDKWERAVKAADKFLEKYNF